MLGNELACIERPSARRRSSLHRVLGSALLLGVAAGASPALASSTLVTAPDGTFQGKFDITGAMREFLGLRYAQPVTGNLRWKAPQPVTPSAVTQDATRFGNHCPQVFTPYGNATQTEDCLFLNVFAPNRRGDHDLRDDDAHPVMVWIHGGGLTVGESNEYDAVKLVQRGVIVVTINYRLGALGFLAHPALTAESPDHTSGNYGIQDQQAALNWVRRNIRAFGGDPERVTIFGESAGGLSTLTNLVSPTAHGLFDRAIVESGTYALAQPTLAQTETAGTNFAKAVGCNQPSPSAVLACLRGLGVPTILANQALSFVGSLPIPNVDGKVLTQSISAALASGRFNHVPLMNGTNHDEYNLFVAQDFDLAGGPITASTYVAAIAALTGTSTQASVVATHYPVPAQFPSFDQGAGAAGTDANFACTARFADELASSFVPTFAYEFSDEHAPQNFLPPVSFPYGASHASEIQYIFPTANPSGLGLNLAQTPLDANQQKLSDQMVGYWTEFARNGDPNGPGQPHWPRFHRDRQAWLSLVPPRPGTETSFATVHQCDFWDGLAGRTLPPDDHDHRAGLD
ncbi:MAG: carboxylesterase family protein [Bradyrhizobium sp.]|uniref:carboxylesterase/lipase family protein n=1 Tax=Bradyrhizobium sp. TaxID=376 RepID=UPI001DFF9691|nr:carboxylesterase family protein [Bradyrhizobium sp.]MBV9562865.1 carboxylesterase family protein [Bradyrhizobium sp.]